MSASEQQFESYMQQFLGRGTFLYEGKDESTGRWSIANALDRLRACTAAYLDKFGQLPSVSSFEIITDLLVEQLDLRPLPVEQAVQAVQEISLTLDEFKRIPSAVAQRRYKLDPAFRNAVDRLPI